MTDIPRVGLLLCGTTDCSVQNACLTAEGVMPKLRAAGFLIGAKCVCRIGTASPYRTDDADTVLRHLVRTNDLVITFGAVGFRESDLLPDITARVCDRRADALTAILCGGYVPPRPDETKTDKPVFISARVRRQKERAFDALLTPRGLLRALRTRLTTAKAPAAAPAKEPPPAFLCTSRAAAGIAGSTPVLNFPADLYAARRLLDTLLPTVCFAVQSLSGKSADAISESDATVKIVLSSDEI